MKLPKLYRVCWVKLYWLTDTCEGGEHVQRDGYFHLKARRVLSPDKSWFWQLDKFDRENGDVKYHLKYVSDMEPEDQFEGWEYKNPFPWSERDYLGYTYNRPIIKPKIEVKAKKKKVWTGVDFDLDDCPF